MSKQKRKPIGRLIVTQSNSLIEADYSKSELSANALKLFKLVIATLSPNDEEFRLVRIKMSMFKQYMGYSMSSTYGSIHKDIERYCLGLNSQLITIATEDGSVINAFAISSFTFDHNRDELVVEISGQLKPFLLQLRGNHTSYQLWNIPRLKSGYSIRLYELLSSRRRFGKRKFELEELKAKVGCTYTEYGIFKRRVILKAQKEFQKLTDLRFEFEEGKTGRKVTSVTFYTFPNDPSADDAQQVLAFLDEEFAEERNEGFTEDVMSIFQRLGISKANLDKMLNEGWNIIHEEVAREKARKRCRTLHEYYGEKLTLLQQSKAQKSPAGFFIKAIKQDWQNPTLFRKQKMKEAKVNLGQIKRQIDALELKKEAHYKLIEEARSAAITKAFEATPDALASIIDEVLPVGHTVRRTAVKPQLSSIENYKRSGMLAAMVNGHILKAVPELFSHIKPLDDELASTQQQIEKLKLKV